MPLSATRATETGTTALCLPRDPYGHAWLLGADIGLVTPEEMQHRLTEAGGG